jgi:hypothetical protein
VSKIVAKSRKYKDYSEEYGSKMDVYDRKQRDKKRDSKKQSKYYDSYESEAYNQLRRYRR